VRGLPNVGPAAYMTGPVRVSRIAIRHCEESRWVRSRMVLVPTVWLGAVVVVDGNRDSSA